LELRKDWHQKKSISLLGLTQLSLIILGESGVVYSNQAGGNLCCQLTEEGWLSIIGEDYCMSKKVGDSLAKFLENKVGITETEADHIDNILRNDYTTFFLSVDRTRLKDSMEAWLYVNIDDQPPVPIDAYHFGGSIGNEQDDWYKSQFEHIKKPQSYPFMASARVMVY
jgi:hypothetical protein